VRVHELKTVGESWDALDLHVKRAEVRFNDRDFRVDDYLVLRRLDGHGAVVPDLGLVRRVMHVFEGGRFGIEPGYVVLSLAMTGFQDQQAAFEALRAQGSQAVAS